MLLYWLWLSRREKLSGGVKEALLRRFRDPEEIYYASEGALEDLEGMTRDCLNALMDKDLTQARQLAGECVEKEIRILTFADEAYPARVRNIYDPPMVLYYKGTLPDWDQMPVIGIVGTRKATPYGTNTARRFGGQIAACGALVVSGGAAGIDTAAMEGAMETGQPVVAVLGCGVDVVYPRKNRELFRKVCQNGCLISEYPPGEQALGWHFLQRNRIITGISNGLLVVEAPEKSGALNSANHALDQGRDVFVVPGNVDSPSCAGSNALLQEQAIAALSGWHVVREYEAIYPGQVRRVDWSAPVSQSGAMVAQSPREVHIPAPQKPVADKKSIDKYEKSTYSVVNNPIAALNEQEQQVFALLDHQPCTVDQVIARSQISAATVKSILTRLTIKGLVQSHPGGRVSVK